VNGWEFNPEENKHLPDSQQPLPAYEIRPGDVLMSRANTTELLGSAALIKNVGPRLLLCDKLYRLSVNETHLDKGFLVTFLRSAAGRYAFERDATGASNSMQNIGQDSVRNVRIPIPPRTEQNAILACLASEATQSERLRIATEKTIALLRERRAALIGAAVTGQIPVPEVSA
jgi:type I restriction enzyme S subunit